MVEIVPIGASNFAWSSLLRNTLDLSNLDLAKVIDKSSLKLSEYHKLVIAFSQFNNESALNHIFFSFLILLPAKTLLEVHENTPLEIISIKANQRSHRLAIITGSLKEWKRVLPLLDAEVSSILFDYFCKAGLKFLFRDVKLLQ